MGVLALSSAIFISQTAEFLPGGLVPQIAADLRVDVAAVGQLITVFAFTVVIATTPLTLLTRWVGRKTIVIAALLTICAGNVAVSLAPGVGWILGARMVGALAHGLFWAVVSPYVFEIAPKAELGRAMAITAAGGSLSGILGIPIGNALGQMLGWRPAFLAVAGLGLPVAAVLWRWLPSVNPLVHHPRIDPTAPRWDRSILGIAMICALILVVIIGQTSFGPYSTTWLEQVAGLDPAVIPVWLLMTSGAGAVGVLVAGHLYDRHPRATFASASLLVAGALAVFPMAATAGFAPPLFVAAICVSFAFAGLPMMLQARMMRTASPQMRHVAGAVQTTAFNVGIGGGALVGGLIVAGAGIRELPLFAATATVLGAVTAATWDLVVHRRDRHVAAAPKERADWPAPAPAEATAGVVPPP